VLDPKEVINALIYYGALEIDAVDSDSGELVYKVTEKLKEVFPVFYDEISEHIYKDALALWERGLLSMDMASENPTISPTEFGLDRNNWSNLSEGQTSVMNNVMRMFEGGI
jgi:hypothetical protein